MWAGNRRRESLWSQPASQPRAGGVFPHCSPAAGTWLLLPRHLPLCQLSLTPPLPLPSNDSFQLQLLLLNPSGSEPFPGQPSKKLNPCACVLSSPRPHLKLAGLDGLPIGQLGPGMVHRTLALWGQTFSFEGTMSLEPLHLAYLLKFHELDRCPQNTYPMPGTVVGFGYNSSIPSPASSILSPAHSPLGYSRLFSKK